MTSYLLIKRTPSPLFRLIFIAECNQINDVFKGLGLKSVAEHLSRMYDVLSKTLPPEKKKKV